MAKLPEPFEIGNLETTEDLWRRMASLTQELHELTVLCERYGIEYPKIGEDDE